MEERKQQKLVEMEKKYLKAALQKCSICFDRLITEDCTSTCGTQYFSFMKLK